MIEWLLTGNHDGWVPGQPFGDGSERWRRARDPDHNIVAWDENCVVKTLIGGLETMNEIANAFLNVAEESRNGADCHVYIAGYRLNPNRDMSPSTTDWTVQATLSSEQQNGTAWSLIRQMMFAGVKVRIMLWIPPTKPIDIGYFGGYEAQIQSHFFLARLVKKCNNQAKASLGLDPESEDLGVVFLDSRTAVDCEKIGGHHQKFIVVRGGATHVAFCGGVDLAYTRRDAPKWNGDWQSGEQIPTQGDGIISRVNAPYNCEQNIDVPPDKQATDLPIDIKDDADNKYTMYGKNNQIWHDQHLMLKGPVVRTMEYVFTERWKDPAAKVVTLGDEGYEVGEQSVISSSELAVPTSTFTRLHHIKNKWRNGGPRQWYYIGYGVRGRSNIDSVKLAGQPLSRFDYIVSGECLTLEEDTINFGLNNGDALEIKFHTRQPKPLTEPQEVPAASTANADTSTIAPTQIWQTMPIRGKARGGWHGYANWARLGKNGLEMTGFDSQLKDSEGVDVQYPYILGEFSNMAGIANACKKATEFIWIFDQYFWSVPYARLLASRLEDVPSLHLAIVLPPWSDMGYKAWGKAQHRLRRTALSILGAPGISDRVSVYYTWYKRPDRNIGVYCHAKTQLFDDKLLVCGSCNINERGYGVDTELCCAVESQTIVRDHYKKLWEYLVNPPNIGDPFPTQDFGSGWGASFHIRLSSALSLSGTHYLREESCHLNDTTVLPNGAIRKAPPIAAGSLLDLGINETTDLVCNPFGIPSSLIETLNLAEIVDRIERGDKSIRHAGMEG